MSVQEALRRVSRLELERIQCEQEAFERVVLEAIAQESPETRERIAESLRRLAERMGWAAPETGA